MKILITSGPTREPIDSVRYISNLSSGATGRALASYLHLQGFEVVFLYGQGSAKTENILRTLEFQTFDGLNRLLQKILGEEIFDAVIHLAAVSDYSVKEPFKGKIESRDGDLQLTLKKNFKILDRIKSYAVASLKPPFVVGFKLTDSKIKEKWIHAIRRVYEGNNVDLVVHNDLSEYHQDPGSHHFRTVDKNENIVECETLFQLGKELEKRLRRL